MNNRYLPLITLETSPLHTDAVHQPPLHLTPNPSPAWERGDLTPDPSPAWERGGRRGREDLALPPHAKAWG